MFPDDPCGLEEIVLDGGACPQRREQALERLIAAGRSTSAAGRAALNRLAGLMSKLLPQSLLGRVAEGLSVVIRRIARQVCVRRPCALHLTQELQDEAVSFVLFPERIRRFEPTGDFLAWCRTVLTNRLLDLARRRVHDARVGSGDKEVDPPAPEAACPAANLDFSSPFSDSDLSRIDEWIPANRVLLLCLTGLWRKIPAERWRGWLEEAGVDPPFPPDDLVVQEEVTERVSFLAGCLGVQGNTLSVRWSRYRHLLGQLDFIRELRDP